LVNKSFTGKLPCLATEKLMNILGTKAENLKFPFGFKSFTTLPFTRAGGISRGAQSARLTWGKDGTEVSWKMLILSFECLLILGATAARTPWISAKD
jgi:hypothetical protein